MPNHVDMDLTIRGDSNMLKQFMEFAREGENLLSANNFIPYPEKYRTLDEQAEEARKNGDYSFKDGFNSGGYEWCVNNWGTKWGIYRTELLEENLSDTKGKLVYNCNSAWSPPTPVIMAMSNKFPALRFTLKYYERGCGFKGTFIVKGGKVLREDSSNYRGRRGG